jgi:hypothetical protein
MLLNLRTVTAIVLLAATAAFPIASAADDEGHSEAASNKFVGTFFGTTQNAMLSFHSDRTVNVEYANMYNFTGDSQSRSTPGLGVWRKVDSNSIRITYVFFLTEAFGDNYLPNGVILRVTLLALFDDPVNGKSPGYTTSETEVAVFSAGQNPTTDAPFLVVEFPDGSGTRLAAE